MAKKDDKKQLEKIVAKSNSLIYGTENALSTESDLVRKIITTTVQDTTSKLGLKTGGRTVDYFNEVNIGGIFKEIMKSSKDGAKSNKKDTAEDFKKFMEQQNVSSINDMLANNADRLLSFSNYRQIYKHIPECAQALDTYKDNIMSPDDFTKMVFNVTFNGDPSDSKKNDIDDQLESIMRKYKIVDKADRIIGETLLLGEQYVAVLSMEEDMQRILQDPAMQNKNVGSYGTFLNESSYRTLDKEYYSYNLSESDIILTEEEKVVLNEVYGDDVLLEDTIAKIVNANIEIGSKYEMLSERLEAEAESLLEDNLDKRINGEKRDNKPLYLNGSSVKILDPERVIDLRIDDICYGYYYAAEMSAGLNNVGTMNPNTGRELKNTVQIGSNNTLTGTNAVDYTTNNTVARELNVDEAKLNLITDIFVKAISKKINKNYIRKNKQFKNFIYSLLKLDYIIKKGVKLTYFLPEEVIKFEAPAIYRKILFFAKLYLATLANIILIKLGRAHDKRVFYVNIGLDADYEQAIQKVIQDIKTKEYKMDNLNDINTILNLNPGRFDDYFMPSMNGDHPVEIDTLPGMDTEMTNEFLEYLKNSMLSGIGVPRDLIDSLANVDFARTLSAQNANFVRSVIKYQLAFTDPFTQLMRRLYINEYRYTDNKENDPDQYSNIAQNILVQFPSPASLNFTNMNDSMQAANSNAEFIASQLLPPKQDGSTEDARAMLTAEIVKDLLPGIDWKKYEGFREKVQLDVVYNQIANPPPPQDDGEAY